jgi:hypothetical protein
MAAARRNLYLLPQGAVPDIVVLGKPVAGAAVLDEDPVRIG